MVRDVVRRVNVLRAAAIAVTLGFSPDAIAQGIQLGMPIACQPGRTCYIQNYVDIDPSSSAQDYKCGTLTYNGHNGTDFRLPSLAAQKAGVEVIASASGRVLRTRDGMPDGAFGKSSREAVRDVECGNGVVIEHPENWETQYCHMANTSLSVKPGEMVKAGQPIGRVGLSGLTEYPHLHFTVRHNGAIVDPFAFGAASNACGSGKSLWYPETHAQLAYEERAVLNAGFSDAPVTMESIEDGTANSESLSASAAALVFFVRAIGLKAGDAQHLVLRDPAGKVIAENRASQLDRDKAQFMLFTGRKRPASGWDRGTYKASYVVERDGRAVLKKEIELTL
ncbi:M23 family metallopeptidase [Bradyrhizobium lablabi]|nr:M23 family metallopeptidase [Bradyrhizobium lablabi]